MPPWVPVLTGTRTVRIHFGGAMNKPYVLLVILALASAGRAACAGNAGMAGESTASDLRARLEERVARVQGDVTAREQAISDGRAHATFCAYCHGPDGNSTKPEIPTLAGQNPAYLLDQIERFASGTRKDYTTVMPQLARRFTAEDKLALVVYYASVRAQPAHGDPALAPTGATLYRQKCQQCHGPDGNGSGGFARLAGQQPVYVQRTLAGFRNQKAERVSPVMSAMVEGLSDDQIAALAAYIANMGRAGSAR
jgi:cytochrome c553